MRITLLLKVAVFVVILPLYFGMAISGVPQRMLLSASMKAAEVGKGILIALNINSENESVDEVDVFTVNEVIKSQTKKHGSVCFVVRRPG
mmetsp:Transcript_1711/g.2447  ORF Transcript_1711/g.2447 Transcript_1711/m.2447 type:complete len:90 (-) Transcript_1711:657-926(-)